MNGQDTGFKLQDIKVQLAGFRAEAFALKFDILTNVS